MLILDLKAQSLAKIATCVIYMVDLSGYNENRHQSSEVRMVEDLRLLSLLVDSLRETKVIIFFNKLDLFQIKIKKEPLTIFKQFTGGDDADLSLVYIINTYLKILLDAQIQPLHYVGSCLNWSDISHVLDIATKDVKDLKKVRPDKLQQILKDLSIIDAVDTEFGDLDSCTTSMLVTDTSLGSSLIDHPDLVAVMKRQARVVYEKEEQHEVLDNLGENTSDDETTDESLDLSTIVDNDVIESIKKLAI